MKRTYFFMVVVFLLVFTTNCFAFNPLFRGIEWRTPLNNLEGNFKLVVEGEPYKDINIWVREKEDMNFGRIPVLALGYITKDKEIVGMRVVTRVTRSLIADQMLHEYGNPDGSGEGPESEIFYWYFPDTFLTLDGTGRDTIITFWDSDYLNEK